MYPSGVSTQRWFVRSGWDPVRSRSQGTMVSASSTPTDGLSMRGPPLTSTRSTVTRPSLPSSGASNSSAVQRPGSKAKAPKPMAAPRKNPRREMDWAARPIGRFKSTPNHTRAIEQAVWRNRQTPIQRLRSSWLKNTRCLEGRKVGPGRLRPECPQEPRIDDNSRRTSKVETDAVCRAGRARPCGPHRWYLCCRRVHGAEPGPNRAPERHRHHSDGPGVPAYRPGLDRLDRPDRPADCVAL